MNTRREDARQDLHQAASEGHLEVVRLLVENGANVNARDENGRTPLFRAADEGHLDIVRLLVENGAEVNGLIIGGTTLFCIRPCVEGI